MNTVAKSEPREVARKEPVFVVPSVDITETKDEYVLEADMPGVTRDGIEVTLDNNELVIAGHRRPATPVGDWLHRESNPNDYRRTFVIDPVIDADRITAHIEQGVLTVRLPKAEKVKPRRVKVTE